MKNFYLSIIITCIALSVSAQENKLFVSGGLSWWHSDSKTSFRVIPEIGYHINKHWAIGIEFSYASDHSKSYSIAPFVRWSFVQKDRISLFIDGVIGYCDRRSDGGTSSGSEWGLKPGISWEATKHIRLLAKTGFLGYRNHYRVIGETFDGFGLDLSSRNLILGLQLEF